MLNIVYCLLEYSTILRRYLNIKFSYTSGLHDENSVIHVPVDEINQPKDLTKNIKTK